MVHERTIKWHDLIEDPTDIPETSRNVMLSLKHDGSFCFFYTMCGWYDDVTKEFLVFKHDCELCRPGDCVLAWTEDLTPYVPKGVTIQ